MHREYALRAVSDLVKVTMVELQDGKVIASRKAESKEMEKRLRSQKLAKLVADLSERADQQEFPVVFLDECGVFWFCILERDTGVHILGGPLTISPLDVIGRHRFFQYYNLNEDNGDAIPFIRLQQFLAAIRVLDGLLNNRETGDDELLYGNRLTRDDFLDTWEEQKKFEVKKEEDEDTRYHHSYQEERALHESIRNGNMSEALLRNLALMDTAGKMGTNMKSHWYNLAVSAITLNTRAAIEGGLSPSEAYRLSDFYIQKLHMDDSIIDIQKVVNSSVLDFTDRVGKLSKKGHTGYVEACKAYINDHYREKIYISDAAEALGISEGYLSRLFHKEEGLTFQAYLLQFRLDRAANLLKYSDHSIGEISTYCCFPSQSYFADKFKKYMELSPGDYRKKYKPGEFHTDKAEGN